MIHEEHVLWKQSVSFINVILLIKSGNDSTKSFDFLGGILKTNLSMENFAVMRGNLNDIFYDGTGYVVSTQTWYL